MQGGIERRKTVRISGRGGVDCRPYRLVIPTLEDGLIRGSVVDVSVDGRGLGFVTAHPVFTGRKLLMAGDAVPRGAEVRWVAAAPQGYRVGIAIGDEPVGLRLG